MRNLNFALRLFTVGVLIVGAGAACGQDYPSKPIRILTAAAGGGSDFVARQMALAIGALGQPVVVDNRASGNIAAEAAFKTPPDGYTLNVNGPSLWIYTLLYKAPFDVVKDFSPISPVTREINVFVVHPSLPVKSIKELIALAKAKPGALNYGSTGIGGAQQLGTELFKSMAGVNIVHVPYKGTAPSITALIANEVQMVIQDVGVVTPHMKAGTLRGLAVASAEPSPLAPGLPTVAATGLPGYELTGMTAIWAPGKPPAAIINRLNLEIVRYLNRPDIKQKFLDFGVETAPSSPEELAAIIKPDMDRWAKVIKDAGIKPE